MTREAFSDRIGSLEELQKRLAAQIERVIGLRAAVRLVSRAVSNAARAKPGGWSIGAKGENVSPRPHREKGRG